MKVISFTITKKTIDLIKPIPVRGKKITNREVANLALYCEDKSILLGEISPLPGLNNCTLEQAIFDVEKLLNTLIPFSVDSITLDAYLFGISKVIISDSAQFAIESALLNIVAPKKLQTIKTNELIPVEELKYSNKILGSVKIKVNAKKWKEHALLLQDFIKQNPDCFIRLDGNCSFDYEQLNSFCDIIDMTRIEYFEEPLTQINQWSKITKEKMPKLALDENLPALSVNIPLNTAAFIIKPQLHGVYQTLAYIRQAFSLGLTPVISSCFEASIGMRTLAQIINLPEFRTLLRLPHGLSTYKYLREINPSARIIYDKSDIIVR